MDAGDVFGPIGLTGPMGLAEKIPTIRPAASSTMKLCARICLGADGRAPERIPATKNVTRVRPLNLPETAPRMEQFVHGTSG